MAPVTVPVFICGLLTCILVEKFKAFGYGEKLPEEVWQVLADLDRENAQKCLNKIRFVFLSSYYRGLVDLRFSLPLSGCRLDWFKCDYSCNNLYRCN